MNASDCATLSSRADFEGYVNLLRNVTNGDFNLVKECRGEVCGALWGSGNPDISGIGMAVGYVLESAICAAIICAFLLLKVRPEFDTRGARLLLANASKTFYDNAIFFTFAIQIASIITLAKANFGISTEGMGAVTMKIAWLVSILTLLPLLPLVLRPALFVESKEIAAGTNAFNVTPSSQDTEEDKSQPGNDHEWTTARIKARQGQRFLMLVICWAMSFYPFFSRMAATFGKNQIGDSPDSVINTTDWGLIERACFEHVEVVSSNQEAIMTAFGVASWLFVTIIVIYKVILSAIKDSHEQKWNWLKTHNLTFDDDTVWSIRIWSIVYILVLMFLAAQFWAFFRLRRFQSDMIEATGGKISDSQWTFGQIVAVVVFIPVVVEVLFMWKRRSLYC